MLNNDIVGGNTTPGDKLQLKDRVRVFSEGVPASATPEQARRIRALGEENDSPSRELARAIADTARTYFPSGNRPAHFGAFLVVTGPTAICAAATTARSTTRDSPPSASPSGARTTTTSIRTWCCRQPAPKTPCWAT